MLHGHNHSCLHLCTRLSLHTNASCTHMHRILTLRMISTHLTSCVCCSVMRETPSHHQLTCNMLHQASPADIKWPSAMESFGTPKPLLSGMRPTWHIVHYVCQVLRCHHNPPHTPTTLHIVQSCVDRHLTHCTEFGSLILLTHTHKALHDLMASQWHVATHTSRDGSV